MRKSEAIPIAEASISPLSPDLGHEATLDGRNGHMPKGLWREKFLPEFRTNLTMASI